MTRNRWNQNERNITQHYPCLNLQKSDWPLFVTIVSVIHIEQMKTKH